MKEELRRYFRKLGAKGGRASAARLTHEQRIKRARKAGLARQAKARAARKGITR